MNAIHERERASLWIFHRQLMDGKYIVTVQCYRAATSIQATSLCSGFGACLGRSVGGWLRGMLGGWLGGGAFPFIFVSVMLGED